MLSEYEKGYITGAIDGEGCLTCFKRKGKKLKLGFGIRPRLSITNTCPEFLSYLKEIIGFGFIRPVRYKRQREHWKKVQIFDVGSKGLKILLPEIKNGLIIKKHQAELLLELIQINEENNKQRSTKGNTERMIEIFNEIKKLNKKGKRFSRKEFRFES